MQKIVGTALGRSRLLRYVVAGVTNTAFGFAVYAAAIFGAAPVWLALLVANVAGVVFNFFTVGGYVFRGLLLARFPRFVVAYGLTYGVNLQAIAWVMRWVPDKIVAQAILTVPMAMFSFLLMRRFVFNGADTAKEP